jgi:hypothetical protein
MSRLSDHRLFHEYNDTEWTLIKVTLSLLWLDIIAHLSLNPDVVLYPSGLCSYLNCNFFLVPHLPVITISVAVILSILYIAERWMRAVTLLMFLLSLLLFTLEESNGILMRCGLYTMVFLAQFIAYYRRTPDLKMERIQFPLQVVAAGYFLAGISKLRESGWAWISDSPQASIQIIKNYCGYYFDSGESAQLQRGVELSSFVLKHAVVVKTLFFFSLIFELSAWVSLRNKKTAFVFGLLLLSMHLGIYYFMHILVVAVFYPMLVFMLNPLYILYLAGRTLYSRVAGVQ